MLLVSHVSQRSLFAPSFLRVDCNTMKRECLSRIFDRLCGVFVWCKQKATQTKICMVHLHKSSTQIHSIRYIELVRWDFPFWTIFKSDHPHGLAARGFSFLFTISLSQHAREIHHESGGRHAHGTDPRSNGGCEDRKAGAATACSLQRVGTRTLGIIHYTDSPIPRRT